MTEILDWSKFSAFADNKINVTYKQKFFLGWKENIVGKGENVGYHHFILSSQCFQKASISGLIKVRVVMISNLDFCLGREPLGNNFFLQGVSLGKTLEP